MTNYKTIVTFKNGTHRIIRMTRDLVAKFVYMFREMQRNPFMDIYLWHLCDDEYMNMNVVSRVKFINAYTGAEYLSLQLVPKRTRVSLAMGIRAFAIY